MISIDITVMGEAAGLKRLARTLSRRKQLHARIAVDVLELTQTYVSEITDHKTATRLGATPTNHLEKVASQIESDSNEKQATIKVPRSSRLAAAFGPVVINAKPGGFLTIPVAAESYGRRARTFPDLVPMRVGPKKTLVLARPQIGVKGDTPLTILYILVKRSEIAEDRSLLPFDGMREQAMVTAVEYIEELTSEAGAKGGKIA